MIFWFLLKETRNVWKKKSEGSVFQNGWIITIIKTNKQTHNKKKTT